MSTRSSHLTVPLRGALVGVGGISVHHLQAWSEIPDARIVAVADIDEGRAHDRARQFGIGRNHVYDNMEVMCRQEVIDFVDIATPPDLHCQHVLTAAMHGVHVLCQKPFATSLDEARTMIEACESAGVRCVVNENYRWRSWYRAIKRMLNEGAIAAPHYARFCYHGDDALPTTDGGIPINLSRQPCLANIPRLIVFDWGIHLIDVTRFLFGDIRRVSAWMDRTSPLVKGEDRAVVNLYFDIPMICVIDISWSTRIPDEMRMVRGSVDSFVVDGENGRIELSPSKDDSLIVTTADGRQDVRPARGNRSRSEAYQDCFQRTQEHFIKCLLKGELAENEARDNLKTLAATLTAYQSAQWNKVCEVTIHP